MEKITEKSTDYDFMGKRWFETNLLFLEGIDLDNIRSRVLDRGNISLRGKPLEVNVITTGTATSLDLRFEDGTIDNCFYISLDDSYVSIEREEGFRRRRHKDVVNALKLHYRKHRK